jgi:hypothetical protein
MYMPTQQLLLALLAAAVVGVAHCRRLHQFLLLMESQHQQVLL